MEKDKPINVAAAVIIYKNRVLLAKRHGGYLEDLWEFPGGKLEKGETAEAAVERELSEELGIKVEPLKQVMVLEHSYPDKIIRLHFILCHLDQEQNEHLKKLDANPDTQWFIPTQLPLEDFCPADRIAATNLSWNLLLKDEEYDQSTKRTFDSCNKSRLFDN